MGLSVDEVEVTGTSWEQFTIETRVEVHLGFSVLHFSLPARSDSLITV